MTRRSHFEKLTALLANDKLPIHDKEDVAACFKRYDAWVAATSEILESGEGFDNTILAIVNELNEYKIYVELDLIFDSEDDFLYRQKGQLKIDNSIIEEFLPMLIHSTILPELSNHDLVVGPANSFSSLYFSSTLETVGGGAAPNIRTKDQDFCIAKTLYISTGFQHDLSDAQTRSTSLAYVVAECKTNLDKTMFQEATATAHDVKTSVPGAKYFLLCEWLDMTPVSTAPTDIDEVIILRKAKRIPSNKRRAFSSRQGRRDTREEFAQFLSDNPISADMVARFVNHIRSLLTHQTMIEDDVLSSGYF